jgi:hypothetical protein
LKIAHSEKVEAHRGEEKMDIEGHEQGPRGYHENMRREEMDKEIKEMRETLNILMLQ